MLVLKIVAAHSEDMYVLGEKSGSHKVFILRYGTPPAFIINKGVTCAGSAKKKKRSKHSSYFSALL